MNIWKRKLARNEVINDKVTEELKEFSIEHLQAAVPKHASGHQQRVIAKGMIMLVTPLVAFCAGLLLGCILSHLLKTN